MLDPTTTLLSIDIESDRISTVNIRRDTYHNHDTTQVDDILHMTLDINHIVNTHMQWQDGKFQPLTTTSYINIADAIKGIETDTYIPMATWSARTYRNRTLATQCFQPLVRLLDKTPHLHNTGHMTDTISAEQYLLPGRVKEWVDTLSVEYGFAARVFTPYQIEELVQKAVLLSKLDMASHPPTFHLSKGDAFVVYIRVIDADAVNTYSHWKLRMIQDT